MRTLKRYMDLMAGKRTESKNVRCKDCSFLEAIPSEIGVCKLEKTVRPWERCVLREPDFVEGVCCFFREKVSEKPQV